MGLVRVSYNTGLAEYGNTESETQNVSIENRVNRGSVYRNIRGHVDKYHTGHLILFYVLKYGCWLVLFFTLAPFSPIAHNVSMT